MRARRGRSQSGFTLIELMIAIAIVGILAAVAIPSYMQFVRKSKNSEAIVALDMMMKNLRVYHLRNSDMPPSSGTLPVQDICTTTTGKTSPTALAVWQADPGFGALDFHIEEPGYYQYQWVKIDSENGTATATADFACDGSPSQIIYGAQIIEGQVTEFVISEIE